MDFDFTPEQLMLRDMTRDLLAAESPAATVRQLMETEAGYDEATWRRLAEPGLLGLAIPEAYGGQGLGPIEQAIVLEEMGRAAFPSPYFATAALATYALLAGGSEEQQRHYLSSIAAGKLKATLAMSEKRLGWSPGHIQLGARRDGACWLLNGTKWLVPYAHAADVLLVAARAAEGITLFIVDRLQPGVEIELLDTTDLTNRVCRVDVRDVRVEGDAVVGGVGQGEATLEWMLERAAVAASAEMLGAARKCLDMTVEYVKGREQFGQPVGSFQAVKHRCAEMLLEVEQAHAATYYAAWALSAGAHDASLAASVAKAYVGGAARKVCGDAIQLHGGIGFTWDYDLHLYFKRAKHLEPLYGDADFHRERALALTLAERGCQD